MFCKCLDGLATSLILDQCIEMLLRIAPRQVEQIDALETWHILFWVEVVDGGEGIYHFLIEEREAFCIAGYEGSDFSRRKVRVSSEESPTFIRGNSQLAQSLPIYMLL